MKIPKGLIAVMVAVNFCLVFLLTRGISGETIDLPEPSFEGELSVEEAIKLIFNTRYLANTLHKSQSWIW